MTFPNSSASHQVTQAIERLRQLTQIKVQANWQYWDADREGTSIVPPADFSNWSVLEINAKGHIAWPAGRKVLWLAQRFVIARDLQGYPLAGMALRLVLTWWAEDAKVFVNGKLVQEGDLFDFSVRVLLSSSSVVGEEITVVLRLVSPGHDRGALVHSLLLYESTYELIDPGFIADELAVSQILAASEPEQLDRLAAAVAEIDWTALPDAKRFDLSLSILRQNLLQAGIQHRPLTQGGGGELKAKIGLVGHAHLDMAWLWPVSETWKAAQRTFESALQLQQEFPNLSFCHSTPALYAWMEQHRPELFAAIQTQVAAGRWEIVGGMWVEPDLNLIDGESIVRQVLYGQRYVQEKFGQLTSVAWLPDSFGFCWQLPQILSLGGIDYFVTQKLRWNDTTKFPFGTFWWQAPDGSQIFSLMSNPIGEGIEPIKMATYSCEWEAQTGLKDAIWLFGVGDHGGGPTRDMLEVANRWQQSPFFPHLEFTTVRSYLQNLSTQRSHTIWNDELYLEFHRGCYTTHADQKRWNRRCEKLLYQAELFASLATISTGTAYPKTELEDAWKKVLFNQFHDILPGTSVPEVFAEANQAWQEVEQVGAEALDGALRAIASHIAFPDPPQPDALPVIVFNSLNWQRSEVVTVSLTHLSILDKEAQGELESQHWEIYDLQGHQLPSQLGEESKLLFLATDIPAIGYRVFWLCPKAAAKLDAALLSTKATPERIENRHNNVTIPLKNSSSDQEKSFDRKDWILENRLLRVIVDCETGHLNSLFDKIHNREILNQQGGNQLQAFQDSGQYWDAWNIDPNYAQHPLPPTHIKSINWLDQGPVQQRLRVVQQLGKSEFCQDYLLQAESSLLKIITTVDWQERHVLVKAAFSFNLEADCATYEIPCGAIQRPTRPKTSAEQAKWEVPALRWADLTQMGNEDEEKPSRSELSSKSPESPISNSQLPSYGVSLLNDCKYGYDSQPNQLRLTLLRSPSWPDPEADRGIHQFTYALYPHAGDWRSAHTVRRGYELNLPLQAMVCSPVKGQNNQHLPPVASLFNLSDGNLILIAFKQSEDNPQQWVLRCYEGHGQEAKFQLQSDLGLKIAQPVDLLERPVNLPELFPDSHAYKILPWKIVSFKVVSAANLALG